MYMYMCIYFSVQFPPVKFVNAVGCCHFIRKIYVHFKLIGTCYQTPKNVRKNTQSDNFFPGLVELGNQPTVPTLGGLGPLGKWILLPLGDGYCIALRVC